LKEDIFNSVFELCREVTVSRGVSEIAFWKSEIERIQNYSKEQAISELVKSMKIKEKLLQFKNISIH
jgi:hypothetical protein